MTSQQGTPMSTSGKSPTLLSYHVLLYNRALHPEHFPIKGRRVERQPGVFEMEAWVMSGAHQLRFECRGLCACELVSEEMEGRFPKEGVVSSAPCLGEREYEHLFERDRVLYINTAQTETLSENLFIATYDEMIGVAKKNNSLLHRWNDEAGACLSMIDIERRPREVQVDAYHLIASGGFVLRTETIFQMNK